MFSAVVSTLCLSLVQLGPTALPAHSKAYYNGVLVETETGQKIFAINPNLSDHESLIQEIESKGHVIKKFIWGGELLVENQSDQTAPGVLTRINETSGYFFMNGYKRDVQAATDFIRKESLLLVSKNLSIETYHGEKTAHLHPLLESATMDSKHKFKNLITILNNVLFGAHRRAESVLQHEADVPVTADVIMGPEGIEIGLESAPSIIQFTKALSDPVLNRTISLEKIKKLNADFLSEDFLPFIEGKKKLSLNDFKNLYEKWSAYLWLAEDILKELKSQFWILTKNE